MKITKSQLKQIIKEEIETTLYELGNTSQAAGASLRAAQLSGKRDIEDEKEEPEEAERTAKGNVTQTTREKHATVGKDKFPIFDKKSAEAAIDLRGHAPEADVTKIINKAAKYAPAAAKKAREADKK